MALWLKILIAFAVLDVVYVVVAGLVVPRNHDAAARALIRRKPAEIFAAISSHADQPSWRRDLKSLEMRPPQEGKTVFREATQRGVVK